MHDGGAGGGVCAGGHGQGGHGAAHHPGQLGHQPAHHHRYDGLPQVGYDHDGPVAGIPFHR
jgi:hypothetical protein